MAVGIPRANEIFRDALEIAPETERSAYLDRTCGANLPLRQAVEALLKAHESAQGNLQDPFPTITAGDDPATLPVADSAERVGTVLAGRYKLMQPLGEGGMGTVWMAEQTEPIRRLVALKLIKAGMDSAQIVARFEAERQALALMDHPNIAKVLDAGATERGRPYFVMELVKGMPITRYCEENHLTARQRLELIVSVCQAVQHAHQKGIIHRDLKPSNVLVASYDGQTIPKVIDFGVAKATEEPLTQRALVTGFGCIVGTLEYMSPEQAGLNACDIDTRSDIYSIGVVLYELLTGTTPLTHERLVQSALGELLRLIREDEPPRPSTRLSQSRISPNGVSAQRQLEMARLVRGELDWIVMKALEKDRERRYETANGLAKDIERYLKDEPVQAGPPSTTYRLRKFAKRNKGLVTAGIVILLTLVSGIVGTTLGLLEAQHQRDDAEQARLDEAKHALAALKDRDLANNEKAKADTERLRAEKASTKADKERLRAVAAEAEANQRLVETRQTLFTFQVARAANLWQSDPVQADRLLCDPEACPQKARDFPWYLYHRLCQTQKTVFASRPGTGKQTSAALSPNGQLLAAACNAGTIHLWEFASGKLLHHWKAHKGAAQAVVFTTDGQMLISGGDDKHIRRWDVKDGKSIGPSWTMSGKVHGLAVHPDGKRLAAGSHQQNPKLKDFDEQRLIQGEVVLWDLESGERKQFLSNNPAGVLQVVISPDGKLLAAGMTHQASVRLWDIATGKDYETFQGSNVSWVQGLAFSHDSKRLAIAGADFKVHLWDVSRKTELRSYGGHAHELWGVAFSGNDKLLASSSWDKTVRLWDVDTPWKNLDNPKERMVLRGCEGYPVLFAPDGKGLIVQQGHNLVHHVLPRHAEFLTLLGHKDGIRDLAFSPNGKHLASIGKDLSAYLWSTHDGTLVPMETFASPLNSVVFSPDNQWVFVGTSDKKQAGLIARWDVGAGKPLPPWLGHPSAVTALAISAKQQLLASGSNGVIKLWDLTAAREIGQLQLPDSSSIQALAFHPTETILAGLTDDSTVTLWDLKDGSFKERQQFARDPEASPPPAGPETLPVPRIATVMTFTSTGNYLAFNSSEKVYFYDLKKNQFRVVAEVSPNTLTAFAVTADENTVAVAMEDRKGLEDRTIHLWDVASKRVRTTLAGHVREISALVFSPDGKMLASGDQYRTFLSQVRAGTIKLWSALPPRPFAAKN